MKRIGLWACIVLMGLAVCAQPREGAPRGGELTPEILKALGLERERIVVEGPHTWTLTGGYVVYSSRPYASEIYGFASTTPVFIAFKDDVIVAIVAGDNKETPQMFSRAVAVLEAWRGKPLKKALRLTPDAVSGATMSSKALIQTVHATLSGVKEGKKQKRRDERKQQREKGPDAHSGATHR